MKLIEVSHNKCVGCRLCSMVCSLVHEDECSAEKSRIKIFRDEEFGNNLVSLCMQCPDAYCAEACPSGALNRDKNTGAVLVDRELCNGCEACVPACPVSGISLDWDKNVVFKCDLCGGDPECVKFCSREAITLTETEIASPGRKAFMTETSKLLSQVQNEIKVGS